MSKFKNEPTRRFYNFFQQRIEERSLDHRTLVTAIGKYDKNPAGFLADLRSGNKSITLDEIEVATSTFGLNPSQLFNVPGQPEGSLIATEPDAVYGAVKVKERHGVVLRAMLKKHGVVVDTYCKEKLGISRQYLYQMFNGETSIPLDLLVTICEDLGESLDEFRLTPLSSGHYLQRIRDLETQVAMQARHINTLEGKKAGLRNKSIDQ